uniref:Uncharacterized protein n=1 Tax=Oryza sativa subsp. japonica TaxID=39947 RepID=Q8H4B5_ORYSJ|nr:hypothetical protein [Oryza sativa Japonica Group]
MSKSRSPIFRSSLFSMADMNFGSGGEAYGRCFALPPVGNGCGHMDSQPLNDTTTRTEVKGGKVVSRK